MPDVTRYLDPLTVEQLSHLRPAARRGVVDGLASGAHRGRFHGVTAAFRQHRPYAPGDEPRRLDWRVLARTDRAVVRQHDAQTNLRCVLLLDATGSMAYGEKSSHAARLVAALAHLLLSAGEMVGLTVIGAAPHWLPPRAGTLQLSRVIDVLDRVRPGGGADWPAAAGQLAGRLGRRAVVVVISDLLTPVPALRAALGQLVHARHHVACCQLLHPDERQFPFRGTIRLRGLEGERPLIIDPAAARAAYSAQMEHHRRELIATCRTLSILLHRATTTTPIATAVAQLLGLNGAG